MYTLEMTLNDASRPLGILPRICARMPMVTSSFWANGDKRTPKFGSRKSLIARVPDCGNLRIRSTPLARLDSAHGKSIPLGLGPGPSLPETRRQAVENPPRGQHRDRLVLHRFNEGRFRALRNCLVFRRLCHR